jgi:hypothetical protein
VPCFARNPTKEALLIELQEVNQPVHALIASLTTDDVEERLLALIDTFDGNVLAEEEFYRSFTRVSLDIWLRARRNGEHAPVVQQRQVCVVTRGQPEAGAGTSVGQCCSRSRWLG